MRRSTTKLLATRVPRRRHAMSPLSVGPHASRVRAGKNLRLRLVQQDKPLPP